MNSPFFHQASGFELHQPIFSTGIVNIIQAPQIVNQDVANMEDVLRCPPPSQYFVGREDTLRQLVKIFSAPVVSIWSTNLDTLGSFVRQNFKHKSPIFLNASSGQALDQAYAEMLKNQSLSVKSLLVLENADPSLVLEDHLPIHLGVPKLITSTDQTIGNWTLHTDNSFHLQEYADDKAVNSLVRSIEKSLKPGQCVTTLVANGGSGKTQVVLEFVAIHASMFSNVWFFDATSDTTLSSNFRELGKAIGCSGENVRDVCNFLGRNCHNWMCIFDNADDRKVELDNYIPRCNHGNIIVTSRLAEISQINSPGCHIDFGDLDEEYAIKLLLKHAKSESSDMNVVLGSKIVNALGCHALAVSTAGAYIHANATCTLGNYLTQFNKKRREVLTYRRNTLDQYQRSIYSAFQLSFEQLSYKTQFLMQICAQFHPSAISMEIFKRAAAFTGSDTETADLNPPAKGISLMIEFLDQFKEDGTWDESVDELYNLSLASYENSARTLSYHKIIHTCVQETITCEEEMMQAALLLLARATPQGETPEEYGFRYQLVLHTSHLQTTKQPTIMMKNCLAQIFFDTGRLDEAERLVKEVFLLRKEIIGEHHPDTLSSMAKLAITYWTHGKLDAAEKLEQEVWLLRKEVIGKHHPDTLDSMANLAITYWAHGKLKAAVRLQEEVLLLRKEVIGKHHPDTLDSMGNLAFTYQTCGKFKAAERLQEEVLLLKNKSIGKHHPDTLTSMSNLSIIYRISGKLEAAEKLQQEVLLLRKELIGKYHPDTLASMANLAITYRTCGQLEAAEKLEEEVLLLKKELIGRYHPDTLTSMANLAITYRTCGKLEAAGKLEKEVLLLRKEVIGKYHPDTLTSMANLAITYRTCGKLEAAERLEEEVLLLRKEVIGKYHPDTLTAMAELASTYWTCGKLEAAEKLEEEVLLLRKEVIGKHHPDTLTSMANLAITYRTCGKLDAAEELQEEVWLLRKEVIGKHHPASFLSMANLAITYRSCGKLEAAEKLEEEVLLLRKDVIGKHHPDTLTSMAELASTYLTCGKLEAAEKLEEQVLLLRKDILGEHHPDTLISMGNLALTYLTCGKLEAAEKLQEVVLMLRDKVIGTHHPHTLTSMANLAFTYQTRGKLDAAAKLQQEVLLLRKEVIGKHHPDTLTSMVDLAFTYQTCGKLDAAQKLQQEVLLIRKEVLYNYDQRFS